MRTLKKTLCLVLAVVMILGLGVIGVSAKDYTDAESVEHKEAVQVLSAVGVFEGDENGAFNGSKALTRAEGAAVVTRLLGVENPNGATTFADTENHWAKGYIAYCADLGIMNGYGDGNFGPDDALTASAFAKFLLVALGYNPNQENMTGASWEIGVTKLVNVIDLAHNMGGLSYSGAITRDDAAKMAYNCLTRTMVEYPSNKTITSGDFSMVENYVAQSVKNTSYSYRMANNAASYTGRDEDYDYSEDGKMQFVENYFPNLKLESKKDDFGVSQNYWYLASSRTDYARDDSENIVKEAADDLLATFTDAVVPKTIRDVIGGSAVDALTFDYSNSSSVDKLIVYIDGVRVSNDSTFYTKFGGTSTAAKEYWAGTKDGSSDNIDELGRGVITRVYRNADSHNVTIAVNGVYLAKAVSNFDGKELPVEVYNNGKGLYYNANNITVGIDYANGRTFPTEIKQEDVDVSSFQKDDYLLITATATKSGEWKYQTVELAETVESGVLNSYRYVPNGNKGPAGNIVVDGKYYMFNLSAELNDKTKGYDKLKNDLSVNDSYKLWLDKNGYVMGIDSVESSSKAEDYLYVVTANVTTLEAKARVIFMDGTEKTITVNQISDYQDETSNTKTDYKMTGSNRINTSAANGTAYDPSATHTAGDLYTGAFYKYKEKSSGEYELTWVKTAPMGKYTDSSSNLRQNYVTSSEIDGAKANPISGATSLTATSKSVAVADKKEYVGVRNFPKVASTNVNLLFDKDGVIIAAFTMRSGTSTADKNQYALLISGPAQGKDGDDTIYTYDAVINSEMTRVVVNDDGHYKGDAATALFDISRTDGKGRVQLDANDKITEANSHKNDKELVEKQGYILGNNYASVTYGTTQGTGSKTYLLEVKDGVLMYNGGSLALVNDDTIYVQVDATDGHAATVKTIGSGSVGNLNTGTTNWLIYAVKDSSSAKSASVVYLVELSGTKFWSNGNATGTYADLTNISGLTQVDVGGVPRDI